MAKRTIAGLPRLNRMGLDVLRTRSRAVFVYDSLREAIAQRRFANGERRRDEEIAHAPGVSRTPVREALQRLQQRGLLTVGPGRSLVAAPAIRRKREEALQE